MTSPESERSGLQAWPLKRFTCSQCRGRFAAVNAAFDDVQSNAVFGLFHATRYAPVVTGSEAAGHGQYGSIDSRRLTHLGFVKLAGGSFDLAIVRGITLSHARRGRSRTVRDHRRCGLYCLSDEALTSRSAMELALLAAGTSGELHLGQTSY